MITQVEPNTRKFLIVCRCTAMRGEIDSALSQISQFLISNADHLSVLDQVALFLLKAEILYLDCREAEALEIIKAEIEPKLSLLPQEIRFIVGQNRTDVALTLTDSESLRQADHLYDQRQLAGTKLWNPQAMVYAYEEAASGRHYEALPKLWQELVKSYQQGSWLYRRQAARRLAREYIQIGLAHSADYHAIIAQDSEIPKMIANHLIAWRQSRHIEAIIQRLLANANLKRHATIACILFTDIADVVPDHQLDGLLRWLLRRCSITANGWSELRLVSAAWEAVHSLTPRLNSEQAREVVRTALEHPSWEEDDRLREYIIRAIGDCIHALPSEDLPELARRTIPLFTPQIADVNYDKDILYLLRNIALRGDDELKNLIGDALYPGTPVNFELLRIADEFGKKLESDQAANDLAEYYAQDVRLQVQRLAPGEEFKKPAISIGTLTAQNGDQRVAVSCYSDMGLRAAIAHRASLRPESIQLLVDNILEMIREPENMLANKVGLINGIIELSDSITPELAEKIFETLAPPASGNVVGLDITAAAGDPNHPLNPFKINIGEPTDVHGGALYALACIEAQKEVYGQRLTQLLEQAMAHPNAKVRKLAFTAARRMPALSESLLMRALLGTRDSDPDVAEAAFLAVTRNPSNSEDFWSLLIYSLTVASDSPHTDVRRAAAFTVNSLRAHYPSEEVANKMRALEETFAIDVSYLVRSQISQPDSL